MNLHTPCELISQRTIAAEGGDVFDWHQHDFYEFSLVTEEQALIGYPPGYREAPPGTLFFYKAGEKHGAWVSPKSNPRFWVVHFQCPSELIEDTPLSLPESEKRVWSLSKDQMDSFCRIFVQIVNERSTRRRYHSAASNAWLSLLLISISRWAQDRNGPEIDIQTRLSPEVRNLWQLINQSVGKSTGEVNEIFGAANYDSVRHAFRKTFGCSPRDMLIRLRMEHACNLLLETRLSIKEISQNVGYARQHEFYRAFRRHVGCPPSEWRDNPLVRK